MRSRLSALSVFHPHLLGIFPILFLYAQNATEMDPGEILVPVGLVLALSMLLMAGFRPLLRSPEKRGLVISIFLVYFFSYGHLLNLLDYVMTQFGGTAFDHARIILALWSVIAAAGIWLVLATRRNPGSLTRALNAISATLVLVQIAVAGFTLATRPAPDVSFEIPDSAIVKSENPPDIYYIILDGYGRQDLLKEVYDYDNSGFLDHLRSRSFFVADSSFSNYCATVQSLTSTMNLEYIHQLFQMDKQLFDRGPMFRLLKRNRVFRYLSDNGYQTVAFASGHSPTEIEGADHYFTPQLTVSEFQNILLSSTPIPPLIRKLTSPFALHRDRIDYVLDKLTALETVRSPKIVFAHLVSPHPPFVFGAEGEPLERDWSFTLADGSHFVEQGGTREEYVAGYRAQVQYISTRLQAVIDEILEKSETPPIIILQGDHGPGSRLAWESLEDSDIHERFRILNAYHLPGMPDSLLHPAMTPINSFRIVLNTYFGTELVLWPNEHYFTTRSRPYDFLDVTARLRGLDSIQPDSD